MILPGQTKFQVTPTRIFEPDGACSRTVIPGTGASALRLMIAVIPGTGADHPAGAAPPAAHQSERHFSAFSCQASSKKPALVILPGHTLPGGVFRSTTAQSGSMGTCRALLR